jgi:hypothetical protein
VRDCSRGALACHSRVTLGRRCLAVLHRTVLYVLRVFHWSVAEEIFLFGLIEKKEKLKEKKRKEKEQKKREREREREKYTPRESEWERERGVMSRQLVCAELWGSASSTIVFHIYALPAVH